MFGKNIKPETGINGAGEIGGEAQSPNITAEIIESLMKFTGAQSLEELKEVVTGVEKTSGDDKNKEDNLMFEALQEIKNNHSLLEAKEMENNEDFVNAILAGFEPEKAYTLANCERLLEEAFAEGEKRGKESIAARKDRIDEMGMKVSGGYKAEIDPGNMTMEDLKKIKERLRKGEKVRL